MHIEHIDVLSNILYVSEGRLKLSKLAHDFLALDKDRPEVCCLIGKSQYLRLPCLCDDDAQETITPCARSMRKLSSTSEERHSWTGHISQPGH